MVAANALFLTFLIFRATLTALFDRQGRQGTRISLFALLLVVLTALAVVLVLRRTGVVLPLAGFWESSFRAG